MVSSKDFLDWEYEFLKDEIYKIEREQIIINEYYLWEEKETIKKRKPAEIKVVIKKPKHESNNNSLPF